MLAMGIWLALPDQSSIASFKILQALQSVGMFVLPPLLLAVCCTRQPFRWLYMDKGMSWQTALFAVVVMLCAIPAINLLSYLNQQLTLPEVWAGLEAQMRAQEEAARQLTEQFMQVDAIGGLLLNIGLMALLPALGEELTFRGVLQSFFGAPDHKLSVYQPLTVRAHVAIWVTAALFSFVHFQFYGFVPRMLMGATFGYMLAWTGSLWVPMLMHFVNNATVVIAYFVANRCHGDTEWLDAIGIDATLWLGILSLVVVLIALVLYPRLRRRPLQDC